MLQPKKTKFKKLQKGRIKGNAKKGFRLAFGSFGIKTLEPAWISAQQIEAARIAINRFMQREGQLWIRIFPYKPITKKPAEVRMGKGKGSVEYWVAPVKPGLILFEIDGIPLSIAKEAFRLSSHKLSVRTKIIIRNDYHENDSF
ncbi:MAG: 50S ribosomal protein L16 [Bacteroides sp.]|nr:MAG: 50S ribosomal protein L16 [Bacteroides sp.]